LGYKIYICKICSKQFNERTGTVYNFLEYPTEVVKLVVYYYYRFKMSLDDVAEAMFLHGFSICYQTVSNWVNAVGTIVGINIRAKRKNKVSKKWHIDATYIKVEGKWGYLYRAIDNNGNLVDVYLSDTRDSSAAIKFLRQCVKTTKVIPKQITTDKEAALGAAIREVFGDEITHRDAKYKNNIIESDYRGIKSRYKIMKGFKNPFSALIFCTNFEEIRGLLAMKSLSRSNKRREIACKIQEFNEILDLAA
jgi:putative transposase